MTSYCTYCMHQSALYMYMYLNERARLEAFQVTTPIATPIHLSIENPECRDLN